MENLPDNAGRDHAEAVLEGIIADINSTQAALEPCLAQEEQEENPVPQNILGTVDRIVCHDAGKEVGHDEPYLLIASFDMFNITIGGVVGVTLPVINVVKIGPWQGVGSGETHHATILPLTNWPAFWDLNATARPIAHPQDVIFLVGLVEHDGSSPDGLRGGVATDLRAALPPNVNKLYAAYVTNMISNMIASIESRTIPFLGGGLNVDDLFGVQQLALTTNELNTLNRIEPVEKSLRFTQRRANGTVMNDYTVYSRSLCDRSVGPRRVTTGRRDHSVPVISSTLCCPCWPRSPRRDRGRRGRPARRRPCRRRTGRRSSSRCPAACRLVER